MSRPQARSVPLDFQTRRAGSGPCQAPHSAEPSPWTQVILPAGKTMLLPFSKVTREMAAPTGKPPYLRPGRERRQVRVCHPPTES